jgi:hypothetical protein
MNKLKLLSEEEAIIAILKKGIGFWKEDSNLFFEYAKNRFTDEEIKLIIKDKNHIFNAIESNKRYYPLSFSQQMQCVQSELYKNTFYQLTMPFVINKNISIPVLEKSLRDVVKRHQIMRAIFPKIEHTFVQVILPDVESKIDFYDFSTFSEEMKKNAITNIIKTDKKNRFDISSAPLFRVKCIRLEEIKHMIILTIHHAIFDALSFPLFTKELITFYESYEQNKEPDLPHLMVQYPHFILDQVETSDLIEEKDVQWWKIQLENAPLQCDIPGDFQSHEKQKHTGMVVLKFEKSLQDKFVDFCKKENMSMTLLMMTGIYLLLQRWTQKSDIIIGSVLNQRNKLEYENIIGDFNNFVPLRLKIPEMSTGRDILNNVRTMFFNVYDHQKIPFINLARRLHVERNNSNLAFYNVFLDSINFDIFEKMIGTEAITMEMVSPDVFSVDPIMDLFFFLIQENNNFNLYCFYNAALLKKETVDFQLDELQSILLRLIENPEKSIDTYPVKATHKIKQMDSTVIFCLPGADGQVDIFSRITKEFKSYRCYAIKYKGLEENADPLKTVEEIASNVIDVMKSVSPFDRCILMGLSTGGVVAFEIMQQLHNSGWHNMPELVLLDSPSPSARPDIYKLDKLDKIDDENTKSLLLLLIMNFTARSFGAENANIILEDYFLEATGSMSQVQKEEYVYNWIKANTTMILPPLNKFQRWIKLMGANIFAIANYIAKPYEGTQIKVSYISSANGTDPFSVLIPQLTLSDEMITKWGDKKSSWSSLFPQININFFIIKNSDHYSLFSGKNMKELVEVISRVIIL